MGLQNESCNVTPVLSSCAFASENTGLRIELRFPRTDRNCNEEAMQVSLNSGEAATSDLATSRQSVRLIDFNCELPPRVDLSPDPSTVPSLIDEPCKREPREPPLPPGLLDYQQDPFEIRHLHPPVQYPSTKGSSSAGFLSTPSLPIAVCSASPNRPLTPDLSSTSTECGQLSPMSVRLSSSADSALDPHAVAAAHRDEMDACGCSDHPSLPPRAGTQPDRPRILPIVENGQRTSYTHYWVIPQPASQIRRVRSPPPENIPSPETTACGYVNVQPAAVTRSVSMPPRTRPKERRYVKRNSGDTAEVYSPMAATNQAFVDETAPEMMTEFHGQHSSSSSSVSERGSLVRTGSRPSVESRNAMMVRVREAVHGVTDEEAFMILQTNRWDVERAIRILKVEQLFRLGVTPVKTTCIKFLDAEGGNLERASARLLKAFSMDVSPSPSPQMEHNRGGSEIETLPTRRVYHPR